ncbi:hypothetical protein HOY80DRAFT_1090754 [Tuber brumale]|nr:hypothetical protein HOY80DRAFT_1090754 [Tuber brumale]
MARDTEKVWSHHYYPWRQPAVWVITSSVAIPPDPSQQGYWRVPPPRTPGALPSEPTELAPLVAYGRMADSPGPVEWQMMETGLNQGKHYTFHPLPTATATDSAGEAKGHGPPGLGQVVDWFVVPIPTLPVDGWNLPNDGPNDGGPRSMVNWLSLSRILLDTLTIFQL